MGCHSILFPTFLWFFLLFTSIFTCSPTLAIPFNLIATSQKLLIYDDPKMAIATQYPSDMRVDATCDRESCRYLFIFLPKSNTFDQSSLQLLLPLGVHNTDDAERFVTSTKGLIANNGWRLVKPSNLPLGLIYPWLKKIVPFMTREGMQGQILLGETNNQGIVTILIYPGNKVNFFLPEAKIILDRLEFKADKLPLSPSTN
jgi:hypothetical protein